ncbi:MAG: nucleoside deaminase [Nitrospirae bacterium]|nr:nucleoside deaminase [Nitrospirota bacterium]
MQSEEDIGFIRMALEEAVQAFDKGEVPVGALVVLNGEIIGRAHNLRETTKDPSAHAEILALRAATSVSDSWRLLDATLYVTKEPCIMCSGAIINSRISRLVYGCRDSKAGGVNSLYHILSDSRLNHQVGVVSGVLENECVSLLQRFFKERR